MLYFLTRPEHVRFFKLFIAKMDGHLAGRTQVVEYSEVVRQRQYPVGSFVFTSLGVLSETYERLAAEVARQVEEAGSAVLNHPQRVLSRYELLRRMHDAGINRFQVRKLTKIGETAFRYPVFIRQARRHSGSLTGLIESDTALEAEAEKLVRLGHRSEELLVIEFCDTQDSEGVFRKYSAFFVAGTAIPRYLDFSRHWVVKRSDTKLGGLLTDARGLERVEEELRYVENNPHAGWICRVAEEAGVEFGRLDYGIKDGVPQLWEINTAPTFGTSSGGMLSGHDKISALRKPAAAIFYDRFFGALRSVEHRVEHGGRTVTISLDRALRRAVTAERTRDAIVTPVRRLVNSAKRAVQGSRSDRFRRFLRPVTVRISRMLS